MKYYHLVVFSVLLSGAQFTLQTFFNLELPSIMQKIFLGMQATLLIGYSLFFLIYLAKRKQKVHKEKERNVVSMEKHKHEEEAPSYSKAS